MYIHNHFSYLTMLDIYYIINVIVKKYNNPIYLYLICS